MFDAAGQTDHWEPLSSAGPLCGGIMKNEFTFCLSTPVLISVMKNVRHSFSQRHFFSEKNEITTK